MALEALARSLDAEEHGYMAGGGEVLEYTVPVAPGDIATDAAAEAIERLTGHRLPAGAFYSARVNLDPHPDDRENYKTLSGFYEVPTEAYKNGVAFSDALLRVADNIAAKQRVLSVTVRIGIPPRGFFAIHGDGILAGPRVGVQDRRVYQEREGSVREVTRHPKSWLRPIEKKLHPKSWMR